ncbi:MAG: DUF3795 domain-containing protein [Bacilli bacterium]|nr:DUF3795 domain-containing protein [Bacilli bacterium]
MKEELIAPCGMNCALCVSYQFSKLDLNKKGFNKRYCPGCIPRGKNCLFLSKKCNLLKKGLVRFCFECVEFPCIHIKNIDNRYKTKYNMSMIDNLNSIKNYGMINFLKNQNDTWKCKNCNEYICCHNNVCLNCNIDSIKK